MAILAVLGVSIIAAILLAFVGDRRFAPEINILGSLATLAASVFLAVEVYANGPMLAANNFFFVDAF
ncbi:MAG: hydrogenase 4 subunit F, partial [Deltaproteobacteria bacterium]|nr:hydrogenase 4 subunit F [Deltaproteobacteria bacterium]